MCWPRPAIFLLLRVPGRICYFKANRVFLSSPSRLCHFSLSLLSPTSPYPTRSERIPNPSRLFCVARSLHTVIMLYRFGWAQGGAHTSFLQWNLTLGLTQVLSPAQQLWSPCKSTERKGSSGDWDGLGATGFLKAREHVSSACGAFSVQEPSSEVRGEHGTTRSTSLEWGSVWQHLGTNKYFLNLCLPMHQNIKGD